MRVRWLNCKIFNPKDITEIFPPFFLIWAFSSFIQISNDASATKVINKFCGVKHNEHETVVTSSGNRVYVHFFSDMSYSGRGFQATYKSNPASKKLILR